MAIYGNDIGMQTAPAWSVIFERTERQRIIRHIDGLDIDWDWLLSFGREYIDAEHAYRGDPRFRGLYFGEYIDRVKQDCLRAATREQHVSDALWMVCRMLEIPETAIIRAARIEYRYYDKGGSQSLDSKRLIMSQL